MIKSFDFYFDFASPYTFIAHKEIRKIEKENPVTDVALFPKFCINPAPSAKVDEKLVELKKNP